MESPSRADALEQLLGKPASNLPVDQEFFSTTDDFVDDLIESAPKNSSLFDLQEIRGELAERFESRDVSEKLRDFVLNQGQQRNRLKRMTPPVLLDLIANGLLPAKLARQLNVSYGTLDRYLTKTVDPMELARAMELASDVIVQEAHELLIDADEKSRGGVMKATEVAKHSVMIAKAFSPRYVEKKVDQQFNTQINNYGEEEQKKESWLRMYEPELDELPPLPEVKAVTQVRDDELNNADIVDGEFTLGPAEE